MRGAFVLAAALGTACCAPRPRERVAKVVYVDVKRDAAAPVVPQDLPDASPPSRVEPSSAPTTQSDCLRQEPNIVKLRGVIRRQSFPGPPNYESVADGDAEEVYWVIQLDKPICVDASAIDDTDRAAADVRNLQLLLSDVAYTRYRHLLGQNVEVSGALFGAHTGHHHTDVLLGVKEIRVVRATPR